MRERFTVKDAEMVYVVHVIRKNRGASFSVFKDLRKAVDYLNWSLDCCNVFEDKAYQKAEMCRILEQGGNSWSYNHTIDEDALEHPYSVAHWGIETQPVL